MKKRYICLLVCIMVLGCMASFDFLSKANSIKDNEPIRFKINSVATDTQDVEIEHEAVFDVNYFSKESTLFNKELAKMSLQLALAASSTSDSFDRYGEVLKMAHINDEIVDFNETRNGYLVNAYKAMGFSNDVYYKYDISLNDTSDRAAHGIASKKVFIDGKEYTLVSVVVRSSTYGGEWVSNYRLLNEDGEIGFCSAGKDVYNHIVEYINVHNLGKDTKIWISGISRGGAVANVAAANVDRAIENGTINVERDNVYAYSIATPNCVLDEEGTEVTRPLYDNLMNVVYETDIVALTAPASFGYKKYGKVYTYPAIHISGKDMKRIKKGKKPKDKDLTEEELALAKIITDEYYNIRYSNYISDYEQVKEDLFKGFTVGKEFTTVVDLAFGVTGDNSQEYAKYWQSAFEDLVPFLIGRAKKYDTTTQSWVRYTNLKEYLKDTFGEEVYNKAMEQGVYSEEEYNNAVNNIENLYNKGLVNEEIKEKILLMVDTYYGIRIAAVKYNIDSELIKRTFHRLGDRYKQIISGSMPITDVKSCMSNHRAELYLAMLRCDEYAFE